MIPIQTRALLGLALALTAAGLQAQPPGPPSPETGRDTAIEQRLSATFAQLEELSEVEVQVRAGVVRLSGEVLTPEARELAGRLAEKVDGTVVVDNRILEVRDLSRRLLPALGKLRERALDLLASLPLLGVALGVVLAFLFLARRLEGWEPRFLRLVPNPFLSDLLRRGIRAVIVLAGGLLALDLLNATALVGAVLGTAGLAGLAVGFAFRDLAENYIASILLSLRQPFAPDDVVQIEGYQGRVVRLTSRATVLMTFDGNHVRIPNAAVFKGILVNYTRNPHRRFDFVIGVGSEEDLVEVLRLGVETLGGMVGVAAEPAPSAMIDALGDSNVAIHFYAWVDQRQASFGKVRSEALRQLKEAFDRAGISMPEPTYQIRQLPAAPAVERPRPVKPETGLDITPDTAMDRQIAADRAASSEVDLLRPEAPQE